MREIKELLKGTILFEQLNEEELEKIAGSFTSKNLLPKEVLFQEDSPRSRFMVVMRGEVEISKRVHAGKEVLAVLSKGDFIGEAVFLDDTVHSATATAKTAVLVIQLTRERLQVIRRENPRVYFLMVEGISKLLSRRLETSSKKLVHQGTDYHADGFRMEHDLLGERGVPAHVYYGVQTLRAIENFPITGVPISHYPNLIKGLAMVKKAAALANLKLELLSEGVAAAIVAACDDIIGGALHRHFTVDVIQGGAGTSTNMNANEVIANRALEKLGKKPGEYDTIHPNNHVNLSQSTNDAYPTALKIGLLLSITSLLEGMRHLKSAFSKKKKEFQHVIKMGRTQLQDAVPMTLGQEFGAYATMLGEDIRMLKQAARLLNETNMGGTAIGTGINADPAYAKLCIEELRKVTGMDLVLSGNLVEATQDTGVFVQLSGVFKRISVKLSKICNDLRLLSSGPRAGLNEINLPPMQPGSSIMPGKVNPVIPEVVNQIAFQVIGNDLTITMAAEAGQLELNVMEPIIAFNLFQSIDIMRNGMVILADRCVLGITANKDICRSYVENSIGIVTALNPYIGYENSSSIAKEALKTGKSVYELVLEHNLLTKEEIDRILSPEAMLHPRRWTEDGR
ncbi:MAG: aspartate ammonia-lyase [Acidobacteria bacterium CG_4_9_14_3_um_filter_49_7]|nr:MAG: aspartate ammonia-lyase [Acidobacteria bacterium CG_4_9_14_3_um_filter_49_7]